MATAKIGERAWVSKLKSPFRRAAEFLRGVLLELKRVVWPSREEASAYTVVVLVTIVVVSIWMGALEIVFNSLATLAGFGEG